MVLSALAVAILGCEESAVIRVQDVPKQVIESEEFAGLHDPRQMILAAMIPHGADAWVFRLSGDREMVEATRGQFEALVGSVSFSEGTPLPQWELPVDWEAIAAAPGALRDASIRVPLADGGHAEISVSRLPIREDWLHYRLRNFNRWRRQLQLPVAHADELRQASKDVALKKDPATVASVVAIAGALADSGQANMGTRAAAAHAAASHDSAASSSPSTSELSYETPPGWQPGPPSPVRRASLIVRDGDEEASIVVTAFPKSGRMADPLANINRWRGEVGMGQVGADAIPEGTEPIEVGGRQGLFVKLDGNADAAGGLATRAVMVERGELVWFFKLHGPKSLVARETEHFRDFVRTVEFAE